MQNAQVCARRKQVVGPLGTFDGLWIVRHHAEQLRIVFLEPLGVHRRELLAGKELAPQTCG